MAEKRSWHYWIVTGSVSENLAKQRGYIELVPCKDCIYRRSDGWCTEHKKEMAEMAYCSFGKRKDD